MRTAKTVVDAQGTVITLGRLVFEVPTPTNHDPLSIELNTQWLLRQRCPAHPWATFFSPSLGLFVGFTHYRCHWQRSAVKGGGDRPAVMFRCPTDHAFAVVIEDV